MFFAGDNGPHREGGADPTFFRGSGVLRGMKRDLYEGGIRPPSIVRWSGVIARGSVSGHVSAFWDFLPTACELASAPAPAGIDGISYVPALLGREQRRHEFLCWEFPEQGGKRALRFGKWKAVELALFRNVRRPVELYDLERDAGEQRNVADPHPDAVREAESIFRRMEGEYPLLRLFDPPAPPPPANP